MVLVIGGGLAGCEAAYKLAGLSIPAVLYEMRPRVQTGAHTTGYLAELVCSNSLKSLDIGTAQGLLKKELGLLGSLVLECAYETRIGGGQALVVERERFSRLVSEKIYGCPKIRVEREEVKEIPHAPLVIVASGPLTSDSLAASIKNLTGQDNLFFYDAVAPIVLGESIDLSKVYRASRYGKGEDDYLNCPLDEEQYARFYEALRQADLLAVSEVDRGCYFEGCMPIEVLAERGYDTLRFGPMRPVGLPHPDTGKEPFAVVQLRKEDSEETMYSLVGFQTRMRWQDQERVFRLIPGLENAVFVRKGVMHRNTYINSPKLLDSTLEFRSRKGLFFAGQITGVEGYVESAATGLLAGINCALRALDKEPVVPPEETMLGSLCRYVSRGLKGGFQPMNANFGLLPPLDKKVKDRRERNRLLVERALTKMAEFSKDLGKLIEGR